jgi:hypothetical protein
MSESQQATKEPDGGDGGERGGRSGVRIDWGSAEVEDGTLSVELGGPVPKGWVKRAEEVLTLLGTHAGWGKISVSKRKLKASDVQEGSEEQLRHLLESAITQANAALGVDDAGDEDEEGDPRVDADRRLARAFRAFAER